MDSQSASALQAQVWRKELFEDAIDDLYFMQQGLMGNDMNNIIQYLPDLKPKDVKGNKITIPLTAKMTGDGVTGDSELEGNEEQISAYSDVIQIDQWRTAVRLKGRMDEKQNAFNMREDAKNKLKIRLTEMMERQIFLKLGGVNNTSITDVNGVTIGGLANWSNTPDVVPAADEASGNGNRYICANYTAGTDSLTSTDTMTPDLISRAKRKAALSNPKVIPLRINGKKYYVMFVHPCQAYDLRNNAAFAQAMREADVRGPENRIFTGALGIYDGVILYESEYCPFLDISTAGYSFAGVATGTQAATDVFRAILCGAQAGAWVDTDDKSMGWVEESFDYGNKFGFSTGLIGGCQKVTFNSKDYGVITVDTAATNVA